MKYRTRAKHAPWHRWAERDDSHGFALVFEPGATEADRESRCRPVQAAPATNLTREAACTSAS